MTTPLDLVTAAAAIVGASGGGVALLITLRARWNLRAETIRNGQDRRENELHRMRHAELYHWWHDMPDGQARIMAMRWFGEWTGARDPYRGAGEGAIPPGFGCADAGEAYQRYTGFLDAVYHPGRLGAPRPPISTPEVPPAIGEPDNLPTPETGKTGAED